MLLEQSKFNIAKAEKDLQRIDNAVQEIERIIKRLRKNLAKKARQSAAVEKEREYIREDNSGLLSTSSPVVAQWVENMSPPI